jgi:ABC-type glycerol-3-phosphate transport system substrate-binding protein
MPRVIIFLVALSLGLAACGEQPDSSTKSADAAIKSPAYRPVTDIHQTMAWILDPAADVIWDSAGTIITAQGSTELAPTTDEGWDAVVHAAASLTEAGNLLMIPGRSMGDDWDEYALGLISAGELAIKAAQDHDSDALFDAGGRIYQVCRACHNQYWVKESDDG